MSDNLISQTYIFIDLFHQYIDLVQGAAIFSPDFVEPESNDANVYPTQTAPVSVSSVKNRADRRAEDNPKNRPVADIRKTPFEVTGTNLGESKQNDM
jgi:hypothetical protein